MPIDMKALARAGAEARITELQAEIAELQRAFPGTGGARRGRKPASEAAEPAAKKRRKRPAMTAAQKKAVSDRMRKYWSERRKAKGAKKAQG